MRTLLILAAAGIVLGMAHAPTIAEPTTAFEHEFEAIEGGKLPLAQWRGKALLVVNTASFCGFTPQYEGLQALWERYRERGLVVIGVPSNDFGEQEPKAEAEILGFCKGAYNVTFPLTTKVPVSGVQAHPFYLWARDALGAANAPRWNFHKYLIGRDGRIAAVFSSAVEPNDPRVIAAIEKELGRAE
jgi:glutathione peroxidase